MFHTGLMVDLTVGIGDLIREGIAVVIAFSVLLMPVWSLLHEILLLKNTFRYAKYEKNAEEPSEDRKKRAYNRYRKKSKRSWLFELVLYGFCFLLENWYLNIFHFVQWNRHWSEQLINQYKHQPLNPEFGAGVIAVIVLFLIGMVFLSVTDVNKMPPLLTAVGIGVLYVGSIYSVIWTVHIWGPTFFALDLFLLLLPVNTILISLRLIFQKSNQYRPDPGRMSKIENNVFLKSLYYCNSGALYFPILGLVCVLPLLGIMVVILVLFGQAPDAAIKAFTETGDFRLSTKIPPQNIQMDEHYLCTVAAGGHKKVVKPLRKGIRHGHEVTVNRQLQIANAFEEIIMLYTPRFHKKVRTFYDTYGFPIARLIKKKWVADVVYFIMKPLEWIFVLVLYAVEVHPEDRIAMQYTGRVLGKKVEI